MKKYKSLGELGYRLEQGEELKKLFDELQEKGLIEARVIGKLPNGRDMIGFDLVQQRPTTVM